MHPVDRAAVADVLDRLVLWVRRAAPSRMSSTSVTTLDSLAYSGPQRVTDLAVQQSVAQPSMTTLVNRLCHEGYAERLPNPQDGRSMLVGVTTEGRRVLGERHAERAAVLEQVIGGLPTEQQSALGDLVAPLRALTHQTPSHESSHL
ncbi:MAG: MarR family transcriptional regulator [Nocardioidaceae bacterium]